MKCLFNSIILGIDIRLDINVRLGKYIRLGI